MSARQPYSLIALIVDQWEKELGLQKIALQTLQEYEEQYQTAAARLKSLADDAMQVWEPAYNELKQQMERGLPGESLERLEEFVVRSKAALTEYRKRKTEADVRFRKAPIDLKQWSKKGEVREEVVREVKSVETRVAELVKDANGRATSVLQYLRDIHGEAQAMYKALQAKTERTAVSSPSGETTDLLQAVHARLIQAGKVSMPYHDFASLLRDGQGSFHFAGKQNDLAYLLLFLNRNGFAENWRGLNLSYLKNGVASKTTAQSIREAQKKLSIRTEPELKLLLSRLEANFLELIIP